MLTLIRPEKSQLADEIEKRLKEVYAAYKVVNKTVSDITYLVESGVVMQGEAILKYLDQNFKTSIIKKEITSDDKFFS